MTLDEEATRISELVEGKAIVAVYRHRASEIVIEFADGSRLFVDAISALEISVT
jgi:hypothetical protein